MFEKETDQIKSILADCRKNKKTSAEFPVEKAFSENLLKDKGRALLWLLCRAGYEPKAHVFYQSGTMKISGMVLSMDPQYLIETKADYRKVLQEAGQRGYKRFRVLMPRKLLDSLTDNDYNNLHALETEAGVITGKSKCYSEFGMILYNEFSTREEQQQTFRKSNNLTQNQQSGPADHIQNQLTATKNTGTEPGHTLPTLNDLRCVRDYIREKAEDLPDRIEFFCSPDIRRLLFMDGVKDPRGNSLRRLEDLIRPSGIVPHGYSVDYDRRKFLLTVREYLTGFKIVQSVRNGKENDLSPIEKKTLGNARELLADIHETDPANLVVAISQKLVQGMKYTNDSNLSEDDCAIGPLTQSAGNCYGYADAFYLCASLAGLKAGYQIGCRKPTVFQNDLLSRGGRHAWNLVQINQQWTIVDLTLDCNKNGIPQSSVYCMIGRDRAETCYIWNHDMYHTVQETTDLQRASAIHEYRCQNQQDIADLFCEMKQKHVSSFVIFPMSNGLIDTMLIQDYMNYAGIAPGTISFKIYREFRCWGINIQV